MQSFDEQPASLDVTVHRRASTRPREWARWLELVLLLGGALGLAFWSVRSGGAPAVVAALLGVLPAIVGLQYGFIAAVGGVIVGLVAVLLAPSGAAIDAVAPVLAPYTLALAVGHYSDRARRTRRMLDERVQSQGRQLEQLFRAHSVLRASHAQLEERLAAREWSLEAAVREADRQVGARDLSGAAGAVLELLTTQGRVAGASIYVARGGELPMRADARLGPVPAREEPGRLVRMAFTHGTLVSLERSDAAGDAEENVLVALPLCTTGGHVVGVVAVHELPFVAFHDAHFRLLATLIAPFSDALARKAEAGDVTARLTKTPSLPPPTRALARLRQTPMRPPPGLRAEPLAPSLSDLLRGSASGDDGDEPGSDADEGQTVEVDVTGALEAVAEIVVVEFGIALQHGENDDDDRGARHDDEGEQTAAFQIPAPANANTEVAIVDVNPDDVVTVVVDEVPTLEGSTVEVTASAPAGPEERAHAPSEPVRESEPEIVLTRPAAAPSNDAEDDDDPTRLHAGPPSGTVIS
ncbi:MAG: hypothetical protein ABW252_10350 [Polyangiales bacterium]